MSNAWAPGREARAQVSADEALALVLASLPEPRVEMRESRDAAGLLLAEAIMAVDDAPPFDHAAMDGVAVRSADLDPATSSTQVTLPVVDSLVAGESRQISLDPGTAVRIMTGARMPAGADTVVPHEQCHLAPDHVRFFNPVHPYANVRRTGEDVRPGAELLPSGTLLNAPRIALLVSQGIDRVATFGRARVAILAIGDELAEHGTVRPGTIRDSNTAMLSSLCRAFGGEVVSVDRLPDDLPALRSAIGDQAGRVDMIVTAGGASSGDRDVVTDLARGDRGLKSLDVRMKPGRPLIAGAVGETSLIGLPGNPAAALVSAMRFVHPAIRRLNGRSEPYPPFGRATLAVDIPNDGGRRNFVRVTLAREADLLVARPSGPQGAANLMTLARADALLEVHESIPVARAGMQFPVQLIPGGDDTWAAISAVV